MGDPAEIRPAMPTQWREQVVSGLAAPFARLVEDVRSRLGRRAVKRGDAARDRRDWQDAAAAYAEALRHLSGRAPVWVQYGHALRESGELRGAEAAYRAAIARRPEDGDARLHLAMTLAQHAVAAGEAGDWPGAAAAMAEAVQTAPAHGFLWAHYGHVLKEGGDLAGAEAAYARAVAAEAGSAQAPVFQAWLMEARARAARLRGDWPAAATALAEAVRVAPGLAAFRAQLGHALKEAGDLLGAEVAYRVTLDQAPEDAATRLHLAELLMRRGAATEAARQLLAHLRAAPAAAIPPATLRRCLDALGVAAQAAIGARIDAAGPAELEATFTPLVRRGAMDAALAPVAARALVRTGRPEQAAALLGDVLWHDPTDAVARRALIAIKAGLNRAARQRAAAEHGVAPEDLPSSLRFIAFGTTGVCNASCIHCPTNKPETAQVPRVTMPMPLFERIVRQIAELHLSVRMQLSFGLFGDALVDPLVAQRVQLVRRLLPDVRLSVNTNGAAYNPALHRPLFEQTSIIALHCESLRAEVYDRLMAPLRLRNVMPKIEAILRDFPGKVHVSIPVSRMNQDEIPEMERWFRERGAACVQTDPLSSRCSQDRSLFDSLAFDPRPIRCGPEIVEDLIVDCDGLVTICCNDFQRKEPIGDLSKQSLIETLLSPERRLMREQFATGRHEERSTCRICYGDVRPEDMG